MKRKYTFRKYKHLIKRKGISINITNTEGINKNIIGAIYVNRSRKITQELIERLKLDLLITETPYGKLSKLFSIQMKIKTNKVVTTKGILVRMGHGKGKIKTRLVYVTKGTVIIEIKKYDPSTTITSNLLTKYFKKYPFLSLKWLK